MTLKVNASHGGSGKQARSVIDGSMPTWSPWRWPTTSTPSPTRPAAAADWQSRLPTTARALHLDHRVPGPQGQPEGDQGLGRSGQARHRSVITPNPKTSGGARWNYLAAWAWALKKPAATGQGRKPS
jgi:ABC-type sulfate transport system substrate-binding protein